MLPGKKYRPEDILEILRRRVWVLLLPFAVISAVTAAVVRKLPDRYTSTAVVLVVPQQVPTDYVKPAATSRLDDQLQTISQQILSRTHLEQIIDDLNLYPEQRRNGIMQDIVEQMIRDVSVTFLRGDAFSVSYSGDNPRTVQKVATALTSAFIDESTKDQANLTEGTSQFLESSTEDMRQQLANEEDKVRAYREKFAGELPTQLQANLTALQGAHQQIQALVQSEQTTQQNHILVERQLADLQNPIGDAAAAPPPVVPSVTGTTLQQLEYWKDAVKGFDVRGWTDARPEVRYAKRMVSQLQSEADKDALERPVSADTVSPGEADRRRKVADLQNQLNQLDKEITYDHSEEKRIQAEAADLLQRINETPQRETEMTELTRDYSTLQGMYNDLMAKKEEADLAANLQRRQIGQSFKLLDAARVPERPTSPNRPVMNLYGIVGGLAVGIFLVGLLEYRDGSFRSDDEIAAVLGVRVLAVVPFMESMTEHKRAVRRAWIAGVGFSGVVAACMAVVLYTFVR